MSNILKIFIIILAILIFLGLLTIGGILIINKVIFNNVDTGKVTITSTPSPTAEIVGLSPTPSTEVVVNPSQSVEVTPPSGWVAIDNTSQHYIAYRPNGWWYKIFSPNMETLGIDVNQIPDASEWAGLFTITRLTASNNFESYKANLEVGYTSQVQNISGRNWTVIKGKTPANELFDSLFVKYAYVIVDGKEFLAGTSSTEASFGGQEGNFDTFVSIIKFY